MKTRVLIVEPSGIIVAGLQALLGDQSRFRLLDPERDVTRLGERVLASSPDVVLINPTLVDSPAQVRGDAALAVVALVYQYVEPGVLRHYDGVVDIRDSLGTIVDVLTQAARVVDDAPAGDAADDYELSPRETQVLVMVAQGNTNKEIADAMNLSVYTVISHRKNIMRKTGIKSVAGLTVYAMLNGLIDEHSLQ